MTNPQLLKQINNLLELGMRDAEKAVIKSMAAEPDWDEHLANVTRAINWLMLAKHGMLNSEPKL